MTACIFRAIGLVMGSFHDVISTSLRQLPHEYASDGHLLLLNCLLCFFDGLFHEQLDCLVVEHHFDKIISQAQSNSYGSRRVGLLSSKVPCRGRYRRSLPASACLSSAGEYTANRFRCSSDAWYFACVETRQRLKVFPSGGSRYRECLTSGHLRL